MKLNWLALTWVCMLSSGCSDPLTELINSKWPPISAEQQRQAAIQSTAQALTTLTAPNVAIGVKLADAKTVLANDVLKKLGVSDIDLEGDKQLLSLRIKFSRKFTEADAGENADLRKLLASLRPEIAGTIAMYAGLTAGMVAPGAPELELRLLPALAAVSVDRIRLADKVDATKVGELLAALLNQYKDNVTGELTRASFTRVTIPALATKALDVSKSLRVTNAGAAANVEVKGNPITVPLKLDGVAWLVTSKELTALVQLVPVAPGTPAPTPIVVEPTFAAVKDRVEYLTTSDFEVPNANSSTWMAVRKDLLAATINSVVSQAALCVSAVAETPHQTVSAKIPMPSGAGISCSSSRVCSSDRQCTFNMVENTKDCSACLARRPWDGGCIQRGNDPFCELEKAADNARRRIAANAAKADCDRLRESENAICELEKAGEKVLCEAKKGALNALASTGNFANVDTVLKLRTNGVKVCLRDFTLAPGLDKVQFALDVQGKALADVNVKFTPLDIVGHLTCQFPWSKAQTFEASLRDSRLGISSAVRFMVDKDTARFDFASEPIPVKARLTPSPVEYLLNSPEMSVACPIVHAAKPLVVSLAPFIKELRGDIDYTLPPQEATLNLALPTQMVAGVAVVPHVVASKQALIVSGELVAPK